MCETAPILGVFACETTGLPPFSEKIFLSRLCAYGSEQGMSVYVFSPSGVDFPGKSAIGYTFDADSAQWRARRFPFPDIVYDRTFAENGAERRTLTAILRRLVTEGDAVPLGGILPGKWAVYRALSRHRQFSPYLPETERLGENERLPEWLDRKGKAFLKPVGASHGKGTLYAEKLTGFRYFVCGRNRNNKGVEAVLDGREALTGWFAAFREGQSYLIQDYLALSAKNGNAFDVRALVQKNGEGRWTQTGLAVREGSPGSMTSNLHGGGKAADAAAFLRAEFGTTRGEAIIGELSRITSFLPIALERHFGRLSEAGIDLGVDRTGRVWVIETNSKPGRRVFESVGGPEAARNAVLHPITYAGYLARTRLKKFHQGSGGYLNEF